MGLENRVALVTGATSEVGRAYVKHLLRNNAKVLLCDVQVEKCQAIARNFVKQFHKVHIFSIKCDVTVEDEFENAFKMCIKHFGRLDIVINNAGVFNSDITQRWPITVNINYGGIVKGTLLAIKYMGIPNGGSGGTVVQTTSLMTFSDSLNYNLMYKTTKKYVIELTKSLGTKRIFGLHGVRIINLCPGFTGTNFVAEINENKTAHEDEERSDEFDDLNNQLIMQKPDNVGNALIQILEHGKTGETWIVEDDKPPRLIEH